MLRIHAPTALWFHPLVTGLLLCARHLNQKHTLVFNSDPTMHVRQTLRGMSTLVSLELSEGPTLVAPSLTAAAIAIGHYNTVSIAREQLSQLSQCEAHVSSLHDAFDAIALAIMLQHYGGVMEANTRLCDAMKELDSMGIHFSSSDQGTLSSVPLISSLEFMSKEAKMPLSPYESISKLAVTPSEHLKRTNAFLRSSLSTTNVAKGPFHGIIPVTHEFIRSTQQSASNAAPSQKAPSLSHVANRNHGSSGSQGGISRRAGALPPQRRSF